jgi:hypothetical protein
MAERQPDPDKMLDLAVEVARQHPTTEAKELEAMIRAARNRLRDLAWPHPPDVTLHLSNMQEAIATLHRVLHLPQGDCVVAAVAVSTTFHGVKVEWTKTDVLLRQMMERVVSLEDRILGLEKRFSALEEVTKERDRTIELAELCYVFEEWVRSRVDDDDDEEEEDDDDMGGRRGSRRRATRPWRNYSGARGSTCSPPSKKGL